MRGAERYPGSENIQITSLPVSTPPQIIWLNASAERPLHCFISYVDCILYLREKHIIIKMCFVLLSLSPGACKDVTHIINVRGMQSVCRTHEWPDSKITNFSVFGSVWFIEFMWMEPKIRLISYGMWPAWTSCPLSREKTIWIVKLCVHLYTDRNVTLGLVRQSAGRCVWPGMWSAPFRCVLISPRSRWIHYTPIMKLIRCWPQAGVAGGRRKHGTGSIYCPPVVHGDANE